MNGRIHGELPMPDQPAHDVDPVARAALADLDARRARIRADIAASPLGRYTAGRDAGRVAAASRAREADAVRWAVRVGSLLRDVVDDPDAVLDELHAMPADEVSAVLTAAEALAEACEKATAGRRS